MQVLRRNNIIFLRNVKTFVQDLKCMRLRILKATRQALGRSGGMRMVFGEERQMRDE
jgi:hypothetical protein